ncbi:protein phosphatase [Actinoplanes sp. SE50]|uniref:PP2C family protein-serine/threonine phosphatase n=1 Tax=unclassified Actinoplanes TaxID=2626549 RepID=UPI00023EC35E|nr:MULTISPECIES: PP2C family protein-serine/threonine phosphatase [unclassified Actinoplanes]AEV87536.1 Protein icfG [Actinoplanes sp. SE50/110]ATO85939.1 protein phosphatase [Actinoplanes sp. SE50]SLM03353.1 protein phosphatase [Actinoplanes sp. SE50/110]
MSDQPVPIGSLLRSTAPDRLPEVAAEHLRRHFAAEQVEVMVTDLPQRRLAPLLSPAAPDNDPSALRTLASQRVNTDTGPGGRARVHLPISCWGERLGVLRVVLPDRPTPDQTDQLQAVADELAVTIRAADRATDRYRRAQCLERLTMAAELQWDLLPGRSLDDERFRLAGQLEPAYDVCGDHFDWALSGDRLALTVLNGAGQGLEAAILTATAVNAMRNARRCGADLIEQAELASDALHARYGGGLHAATVLLEVDLVSGWVEAVDAGSPHCMIGRGNDISQVRLEQQLPLGMFGEAHYEIERFRIEPGDRLLVISDGVHAAAPGGGPTFGESALLSALRGTRLQPPAEAVGTVMRGLREFHAGAEPEDDAVTVCLDWRR